MNRPFTSEASSQKLVLLFSLPWLEPHQAPLGISIVKSILDKEGIRSHSYFPNIGFYEALYDNLGKEKADFIFRNNEIGEVAAGYLYRKQLGARMPGPGDLMRVLEKANYPKRLFDELVRQLESFTHAYLGHIEFDNVLACGFTLTIRQTAASLYWAEIIKERYPQVSIVFGGNQCEQPMGQALFEGVPSIDYMLTGEADYSIGPFFRALKEEAFERLYEIPCLQYRKNGKAFFTGAGDAVQMKDVMPPDYDEFINRFNEVREKAGRRANLYLEGSRGCWWGQKNHCVFCGIHTSGIAFREKNAESVFAEARSALSKYKVFRIAFSDTILSTRHIKALLPLLEEYCDKYYLEYFVDVKSNLTKEEVYLLARSGCKMLQVGIETFSDRLLRKMKKGNTALQQIRVLKWCTEAGILPYYSILTHVIGERCEDYEEILDYLSLITHLPPPSGVFPIEINRYAPYYKQWEELGFKKPQPADYYALMFPENTVDLQKFAYHFKGVHPSTNTAELRRIRSQLKSFATDEWPKRYWQDTLTYQQGPSYMEISSTGSRPLQVLLEGVEAEVYKYCDDIRSYSALRKAFGERISETALKRTLEEWRRLGILAVQHRGPKYLALAVKKMGLRPQIENYDASKAKRHHSTEAESIL